jgi:stearoyl-CoA desaturase (Delta-9 desaturase)
LVHSAHCGRRFSQNKREERGLLHLPVFGFGVWAGNWWAPILFLVVAGHLTNACISLFLHRQQTHRSVALHSCVTVPMRVWLWLSTSIKTKEWVACHRKHHAFADREGDPHSPVLVGLTNVILKGYFYYRAAVQDPETLEKYGTGTPNDWLERHLVGRLGWLGIGAMFCLDAYLFGFIAGGLVWIGQMLWVPLWAAGVVNGVGHAAGYRNFDIKGHSRNIVPIGIWLGGEELHNNHHADPHSPKFKARWFEVDMGWTYIQLLSLLGLARPLRAVPASDGRAVRPSAVARGSVNP